MIKIIDKYLSEIDALRISFDKIIPFLSDNLKQNRQRFNEYIDDNGLDEFITKKEAFPDQRHSDNVYILHKELRKSHIAFNKIPPILLINSLSVFENYLSELMIQIFKKYPQKFDDKNVSIKDLRHYESKGFSLEESMKKIISDKIEEELRAGYQGKIKLLKKMDINNFMTNKEEAEFGYFYELRNIIAHHNGTATNKFVDYINNNKNLSSKNPRLKRAKKSLEKKQGYKIGYELKESFSFLMKIGLRLGEVVARKYSNIEDEELNSYYNSKALDFLDLNTSESNLIAFDLFTYGLEDFNFKDNKNLKKYFQVNECLALKSCIKDISKNITYIKKHEKSISDDKIIKVIEEMEKTKKDYESDYLSKKKQLDISSKSNIFDEKMFEFAVLILDENYKEASKLLLDLDIHNESLEADLRRFPMLKDYRKTRTFKIVFKKIFNKDFIPSINIDSYE